MLIELDVTFHGVVKNPSRDLIGAPTPKPPQKGLNSPNFD